MKITLNNGYYLSGPIIGMNEHPTDSDDICYGVAVYYKNGDVEYTEVELPPPKRIVW